MTFWVASKLDLRKLGQGGEISSLHLTRWEKPFCHTSPYSHPQSRLQRTHCVNRPLGCGPQGGPSSRGRQKLRGVGVGAAGLSCTPRLRFALPLEAAPCLQTVIPHSLEHGAEESIEGIGSASDDHHGWWDLENNPNFAVVRYLTPPTPPSQNLPSHFQAAPPPGPLILQGLQPVLSSGSVSVLPFFQTPKLDMCRSNPAGEAEIRTQNNG